MAAPLAHTPLLRGGANGASLTSSRRQVFAQEAKGLNAEFMDPRDGWAARNTGSLWVLRVVNVLVALIGVAMIVLDVYAISSGQFTSGWFVTMLIAGVSVTVLGLFGVLATMYEGFMVVYHLGLFFMTILLVWMTAFAVFNRQIIEDGLQIKFEKNWGTMYEEFPPVWKTAMAGVNNGTCAAPKSGAACWTYIKDSVMEDVIISGGFLGSCAFLVLLCLFLSTRALGVKAARVVKIFMDTVMLFLGFALAGLGAYMLISLPASTKWIALPLVVLGSLFIVMGTVFGVVLTCCDSCPCSSSLQKGGVLLWVFLFICCAGVAIGCIAFESKVGELVDDNMNAFCDDDCMLSLTKEWAAATTDTRSPTGINDATNTMLVKAEIKEVTISNIDAVGWGMILMSMYVAVEIAATVTLDYSKAVAPRVAYGGQG